MKGYDTNYRDIGQSLVPLWHNGFRQHQRSAQTIGRSTHGPRLIQSTSNLVGRAVSLDGLVDAAQREVDTTHS